MEEYFVSKDGNLTIRMGAIDQVSLEIFHGSTRPVSVHFYGRTALLGEEDSERFKKQWDAYVASKKDDACVCWGKECTCRTIMTADGVDEKTCPTCKQEIQSDSIPY